MVKILFSGVLAPTSMTFMSFIGPLLLAGLLHMEESYCMLYMPVYLVTIPSMYILLVIYSLFNLWNTGDHNSSVVKWSSSIFPFFNLIYILFD